MFLPDAHLVAQLVGKASIIRNIMNPNIHLFSNALQTNRGPTLHNYIGIITTYTWKNLIQIRNLCNKRTWIVNDLLHISIQRYQWIACTYYTVYVCIEPASRRGGGRAQRLDRYDSGPFLSRPFSAAVCGIRSHTQTYIFTVRSVRFSICQTRFSKYVNLLKILPKLRSFLRFRRKYLFISNMYRVNKYA